MTSVLDGVRARLRPNQRAGEPAARFLDRPYATVQLLLLCGIGLLGFGVLMAVSTTIAAAHDANGGGGVWGQVIKEVEFIAIGLVLFWFAVRMSPKGFRYLAYPVLVLAVISLVAVLVPGVGVRIFGARRWIDVGPM